MSADLEKHSTHDGHAIADILFTLPHGLAMIGTREGMRAGSVTAGRRTDRLIARSAASYSSKLYRSRRSCS